MSAPPKKARKKPQKRALAEKPAAGQEQVKGEAAVTPPAPIDRPTQQQAQATEKAETPAPAEPKKPTAEELLARLEAATSENAKAINVMAAAIVKLNEKIEAKPENPSGTDSLTALAQILSPKGGSMDEFARTADSFAKAADALERFRHPSPIGLGEAFLMRLGLRAGYPRYMTKAELERIERESGIFRALEGAEEGEEHVRE